MRSLREATVGAALAEARLCYDHVARRAFDTTLELLGVELQGSRRPLALRCIDWSERRPHAAGAFGAALASRALAAGWVERREGTRALRVTPPAARLRVAARRVATLTT